MSAPDGRMNVPDGKTNVPDGGSRSASKQVLITGGAGFIGSHLAQGLLAAGHRVRVLDALLGAQEENCGPVALADGIAGGDEIRVRDGVGDGVERVRGDVRDPQCVKRALRGVEVIFHLAATARTGDAMQDISHAMSVNAQGTAVLLQTMLEERVTPEKVIVASSMSLYGEGQYVCSVCSRPACPAVRPVAQLEERRWEVHCADCGGVLLSRPTVESKRSEVQSLYALSKRTQEEMCLIFGRTYGVPVTALRAFNVYGPGQDGAETGANAYGVATLFAERLLENEAPLLLEDGEQMRDFVHVRDVVQANLLAMERTASHGEVINVGYGTPIRMRRVAELLAQALERPIAPVVTERYRVGDIRHCYADVSKARKLLGYQPKVTHEQGLCELALWMAEKHGKERSARGESPQASQRFQDGTGTMLQAVGL